MKFVRDLWQCNAMVNSKYKYIVVKKTEKDQTMTITENTKDWERFPYMFNIDNPYCTVINHSFIALQLNRPPSRCIVSFYSKIYKVHLEKRCDIKALYYFLQDGRQKIICQNIRGPWIRKWLAPNCSLNIIMFWGEILLFIGND